jgi:hypothetical protein
MFTEPTTEEYDEMLNECYGTVQVGGLEYDTAEVLKAVDPVAYRCGFADYHSERLEEAADEWMRMDTEERVEVCQEHAVCVFAARRDSLPNALQ